MGTLIGYARVPPQKLDTDHQILELAAAGVRPGDLYVDRGITGVRTDQPQLDCAMGNLKEGDTLIITTLWRLGRSTPDLLTIAERLRASGAGFRVLDIAEPPNKASTLDATTVLSVLTAVAGMEFQIARERIQGSVFTRRPSGTRRVGRRATFTEQQIRNALRLIESGEQPSQVARDLGMSRATLYRRINDIQQ